MLRGELRVLERNHWPADSIEIGDVLGNVLLKRGVGQVVVNFADTHISVYIALGLPGETLT